MSTAEKDLQLSEYKRAINSVLLLRDMHECQDPILKRQLYEQAFDQEASHIAEILPGPVHTEFDFESTNGELYVLQPEGVVDWLALHSNGLDRARRMARSNPKLKFYEQIAEAELEEAKMQKLMVSSGQPQTLVTLSMCGDDVASDESLESIGRDPNLRRAYLRTSIFDGQKLHLDSRTMDYMNLDEAKRIHKEHLGIDLQEHLTSIDILKTRKLLNGARFDLPDKISSQPRFNNYDFVLNHPDLLNAHMESLSAMSLGILKYGSDKYADDLRYDIMSSFKQRLEGKWISLNSLGESVANAGSIERSAGTEYSGCDTVVATQSRNPKDAGYINAMGRELWTWREGTCRIQNCPSRKKEKKAKPKIGPCDICKICQPLFDSGMELSDIEVYYRKRQKTVKQQVKKPDVFEVIVQEIAKYGKQSKEKRPKS